MRQFFFKVVFDGKKFEAIANEIIEFDGRFYSVAIYDVGEESKMGEAITFHCNAQSPDLDPSKFDQSSFNYSICVALAAAVEEQKYQGHTSNLVFCISS